MLPPLRRVSGSRLRRSLSTAASRPPWAMVYRISTAEETTRGASLSLATPPLTSRISIPKQAFELDAIPANTDRGFINVFGSSVVAASGDGLLLLSTFKNRARVSFFFEPDGPIAAPFEVFDEVYARSCGDPTTLARFVCNPITGQLFRLPDFDGVENTFTAGTGLLTQADGEHGPPKRYAVAHLTVLDGGRRFLLRRYSSETGEWNELVLPSPLPPERRMNMNHEVLDCGDRLWWVDVSWGAVSVDPFSDRPELCPVELPGGSMLPDQQSEAQMRQLVMHRRMGVSAGKLRYAEVPKEEPFRTKSFTLDDENGRWTLEHQMSLSTFWPSGGPPLKMPLVGAIDPLNTDLLCLILAVGEGFCVSVDMRRKRLIQCSALGNGIHPSKCESSFLLPCVLPSFLGSSPIPGDHGGTFLLGCNDV